MVLPSVEEGQTGRSDPINLANASELTVRQLTEKVIDLKKSKSKLVLKPLRKDDPLQRHLAFPVLSNCLTDILHRSNLLNACYK
jgi:hypothetical protein